MLTKTKSAVAGLTAVAILAASTLSVVPAAQAAGAQTHKGTPLMDASYKHHKGGSKWNEHDRRGHRGRDSNFAAGLLGFAAGAFLGSALSHQQYSGSNWDAYCSSKYKTYKPWTGTYTGYDGREHSCRYP